MSPVCGWFMYSLHSYIAMFTGDPCQVVTAFWSRIRNVPFRWWTRNGRCEKSCNEGWTHSGDLYPVNLHGIWKKVVLKIAVPCFYFWMWTLLGSMLNFGGSISKNNGCINQIDMGHVFGKINCWRKVLPTVYGG
jgi:hypothetical protein